jgi:hypothetical protein
MKFVSFCSNHNLGTALPPPSVGGLRPNSPVTCGFAVSLPALSRRPCAIGAGTPSVPMVGRELAPRRAAATCRLLRDVQFVPILTSFGPPLRHASAALGRDLLPPGRPRWRRLTLTLPLQALGLRPP